MGAIHSPKFQPDHLKRWTRFFETFPPGPNRPIELFYYDNVIVAKTSYQFLGILSFSDRERASRTSTEIRELTLVVKKSTVKLSGVSTFRE